MVDTDVAVLERAKGLIESLGWGQGQEVCNNGGVCAIGAVLVALGGQVKEFLDEKGVPYKQGVGEFDRSRFYIVAPGQGDMPHWGARDEAYVNNAFQQSGEVSPRQRYRDVTVDWRKASGFNRLEEYLDKAVEDIAAALIAGHYDPDLDDTLDVTAGIIEFNDGTWGSRDRVLAVFDRAIELARHNVLLVSA